MKFLDRKVIFTYKGKEIGLDLKSASCTIPYVNGNAFEKVIKISISCYMVLVKKSKEF